MRDGVDVSLREVNDRWSLGKQRVLEEPGVRWKVVANSTTVQHIAQIQPAIGNLFDAGHVAFINYPLNQLRVQPQLDAPLLLDNRVEKSDAGHTVRTEHTRTADQSFAIRRSSPYVVYESGQLLYPQIRRAFAASLLIHAHAGQFKQRLAVIHVGFGALPEWVEQLQVRLKPVEGTIGKRPQSM